ncbi:MAG: hypothetical protein ACYDAI_02555 [Trichloromonadaceae bacterium]
MNPTLTISRELACQLVASAPRPVDEVVAELSLLLDLDAGGGVTCAGYSALWGWSQGRVGRYMESRGWRIEGGGRGRGKTGQLIFGQGAPQPKEQPGEGVASPPPRDEEKEIEEYISYSISGPKVRDPAALAAHLRRQLEKEGGLNGSTRSRQLAQWRASSAPPAAPPAASWEEAEAARLKKRDEETAARWEKMDKEDYEKYELMNELDRARVERLAGAETAPGSPRWNAEIAKAVRKLRPSVNVGNVGEIVQKIMNA